MVLSLSCNSFIQLFWSLFLAICNDEHPAIALQNSCDISLQQTQWQHATPIQYTSKLKIGHPSETKSWILSKFLIMMAQ